ncbi:MAG: hypothetical protein GY714_14120 [Desulfobacterales bacterium]|nr:hypothetical protein [Desulfobacterales bacterium]
MTIILDPLGFSEDDGDKLELDTWLTARDNCGYMPIHVAAQFDSIEIFKILDNFKLHDFNRALRNIISDYDIEQINKMKQLRNKTKDGELSLFFFFFLK